MKNISHFLFLLIALSVASEARDNKLPPFDLNKAPKSPDYSQGKYWSALPFRQDAADVIPDAETWISDSSKQVDVFYIYPTIFTKGSEWNADLSDEKLNQRIDDKPVRYQASVFNASCRVYAPRYRQAILDVFFKDSLKDSEKALELAYSDVKAAFEYYLKHYNQGRPIIIAGHSQGSWHTRRLLKEYFDNTILQKQLVAGYIIGYNVREDMYQVIKRCQDADATGCYVTWMSYKTGHTPEWKITKDTEGVNPLTWSTAPGTAEASLSKGAILLNFNKPRVGKTSAALEMRGGQILAVKTRLPVARLMNNMHILDYNLFWYDIRENVRLRVEAYLQASR
jgi:Protein of unknown function (DUF3089)